MAESDKLAPKLTDKQESLLENLHQQLGKGVSTTQPLPSIEQNYKSTSSVPVESKQKLEPLILDKRFTELFENTEYKDVKDLHQLRQRIKSNFNDDFSKFRDEVTKQLEAKNAQPATSIEAELNELRTPRAKETVQKQSISESAEKDASVESKKNHLNETQNLKNDSGQIVFSSSSNLEQSVKKQVNNVQPIKVNNNLKHNDRLVKLKEQASNLAGAMSDLVNVVAESVEDSKQSIKKENSNVADEQSIVNDSNLQNKPVEYKVNKSVKTIGKNENGLNEGIIVSPENEKTVAVSEQSILNLQNEPAKSREDILRESEKRALRRSEERIARESQQSESNPYAQTSNDILSPWVKANAEEEKKQDKPIQGITASIDEDKKKLKLNAISDKNDSSLIYFIHPDDKNHDSPKDVSLVTLKASDEKAPGGKYPMISFDNIKDKGNITVTVQRVDAEGNLIKDSFDTLKYKDGKLAEVVPGKYGETRVKNFDAMEKNLNKDLEQNKDYRKDDGISIQADEKTKETAKNIGKTLKAYGMQSENVVIGSHRNSSEVSPTQTPKTSPAPEFLNKSSGQSK